MVPVLGPNEAQVLEVSLQKEFSERKSDMRLPRWHEWKRTCLQMQETQEIQLQSLGWGDPLEKGMATQSSILAWKIPWTEELGRL